MLQAEREKSFAVPVHGFPVYPVLNLIVHDERDWTDPDRASWFADSWI